MANDDFPRGLVPLNWRPAQWHYYRVSTAADIFLGEPVAIDTAGTGFVVRANSGTGLIVPWLGVAVGFAGTLKRGLATNDPFLDVSDLAPPSPASDTGDRFVLVADDPNDIFVMQEDTGGTALVIADIGGVCGLVLRSTQGNTDTGWSNYEIDRSTIAASTAGVVRILALHDVLNSDGTENAVGNFGKWQVDIVHRQRGGAQFSVYGV